MTTTKKTLEDYERERKEFARKVQARNELLDKEKKLFREKVSDLHMYAQAADFMSQEDRDLSSICSRVEQLMADKYFGTIFKYMADSVREVEGLSNAEY